MVSSAERGASVASAVAAEVSAVLANTSTRTLILGIDKTGQIRQHDRVPATCCPPSPAR